MSQGRIATRSTQKGGVQVASASKAAKYLKSYGYEEGTYRKISGYITAGNHKKSAIALAICTCIFAVMGLLRALDITDDATLPFFVAMTAASVVALVLEMRLHSKSDLASALFFYVAFTLAMIYVLMVGVASAPDERTVTICLLLCAAPSLLTDRPWRVILAATVAAVIFIAVDVAYKSSEISVSDTVNTLCSLGLGLAMGLSAQKARVEGYVDRYAKSRAMKTDGLTGILNKTAFQEESSFMIEAGMTGALLVIDADRFKHVNDTYGHAKGDEVLRAIGQSIDLNRRGGDLVGRFGGDEFCVLLVGNIPPDTPQNYFNRLTGTFRDHCPQDVVNAQGQPLTLSCGAALIRPGYTFESAFAIADAALYEAKQARNNVIVVR